MPLNPNTIKVGNCYKTSGEQHRRVIEITGDQVTYESWGGKAGYRGGPLSQNTASLDTFSNAVDGSISCPTNLPPMPRR